MPEPHGVIDVLIVGAGPTGLTLAVDVARRGVSFRVVDQAPRPSRHSKALVVQPRTLEVFDDLGIAERALAAGFPLPAFNAYVQGRRIARLDFGGLDSPYPSPLTLSQSETERLLAERLGELGGRVEREVELVGFSDEGSHVAATLRGPEGIDEEVRCRWLAACDGAHSTVRHELHLPFEGARYDEDFVLADVRVDWNLPRGEGFAFLYQGDVMAGIPMPGDRRYRLIATIPEELRPEAGSARDPRAVPDPTLEEIQALVDARAPVPGRVSAPAWLAGFRLHRRIVPRFAVGRVFLLGDAAHIHSPVGAQGMNTGVQDAYNLGWKLGLVAAGAAPERLLESYDAERRPVAERIVRLTDILFRAALGESRLMRLARRTLPRIVLGSEALRRRGARTVSQLGIGYRGSPIVAEGPGRFTGGPVAGDRAPDEALVVVENHAGRGTGLLELFRGTGHTLLAFLAGAAAPRTSERLGRIDGVIAARQRIPIAGLAIVARTEPGDLPGWTGALALDRDGCAHHRYGVRVPSLYLVRPDGHVAYRGALDEAGAFADQLDRAYA